MNLFYTCNLFNKDEKETHFSFLQNELELVKQVGDKAVFTKNMVEYTVQIDISNLKEGIDTLIIPIKDNKNVLLFTLNKLKEHSVIDNYNIIVVDDRSTENIKQLCEDFNTSYIRVDNSKGFNFSMLNNIAFYACQNKRIKNVIMWNSDLWPDDCLVLDKLVNLHNTNKCTISGTKLLYPETRINEFDTSENIKHYFPHKFFSFKGKVQFGNGDYVFSNDQLHPLHIKRFSDRNSNSVNYNGPSRFITGAFQIIDLEWILSTGGLNPSLPQNYQDSELCLRAIEEGKKVFYFGENLHLFHAESVTLLEEKKRQKFSKDVILFNKLWDLNRKFKLLFGE